MDATTVLGKVSPPITKMIRMDHTHVMLLAHKYSASAPPDKKKAIVTAVCATPPAVTAASSGAARRARPCRLFAQRYRPTSPDVARAIRTRHALTRPPDQHPVVGSHIARPRVLRE